MRALPQTVPTPVVVFTKLAASIRAGPFSDGSVLEAAPVYVATDFAYVPSAPVHVDVRRLLAAVAANVALDLLDRLAVEPVGDRDPRHDEQEAATEARMIRTHCFNPSSCRCPWANHRPENARDLGEGCKVLFGRFPLF